MTGRIDAHHPLWDLGAVYYFWPMVQVVLRDLTADDMNGPA